MSTKAALKIVPRKHAARGNAHHGWLKTFHTFVRPLLPLLLVAQRADPGLLSAVLRLVL